MKQQIWYNDSGEYVGATGVDSVRELAELVVKDGFASGVIILDKDDPTVDEVEEVLLDLGVHALAVPVRHFPKEQWDSSRVRSMGVGDKPGRGFIKVLGLHL